MWKLLFFLVGILTVEGAVFYDNTNYVVSDDESIVEAIDIENNSEQEEDFSNDLTTGGWDAVDGDVDYTEQLQHISMNFIASSTTVHLEQLMWNGEICYNEMVFAWQEMNRCLDKMKDSNTLEIFMDWFYLGEFMQWQVTKAMAHEGRYIPDHRLIPNRFREFIEYFPQQTTNLMDIDTFPSQKYAIYAILHKLCQGFYYDEDEFNQKLDEVKQSLIYEDVKYFFNSLKIEEYVSDINNAWYGNFNIEWQCYDSEIESGRERSVIGRIREFAVSQGLDKCIQLTFEEPIDLKMMYAYTPNLGNPAPGSPRKSWQGAPSSYTKGGGGAPTGK